MDKKELRIVYMGTPDFAVESLRRLVENGYNIAAVVTMPDKPAGRGHKIQFSPVKEYALSQGLPVLQPERLKEDSFVTELRELRADLQIVVAFRMLPEVVWNMPRLGTFNLHASLLPQYRGAAPLNWAIINGDTETGITTFFLKHEIDTGRIIQQRRIPILPEDNVGTIHDKLMTLGADMVVETVDAILAGDLVTVEQDSIALDTPLRPAPKIFKETGHIDWNRPAEQIHNLVRGLSPYPAAWCEWVSADGKRWGVKIYRTTPVQTAHSHAPGSIHTDGKNRIEVACADGYIRLEELQLAGKKRLSAAELLRGFNLSGEYHCE